MDPRFFRKYIDILAEEDQEVIEAVAKDTPELRRKAAV